MPASERETVARTDRVSARRRGLWVIKLGGSLAGSPLLRSWLDTIAGGGGRLVLVPGGGGFADTVRQMQDRWGFGDRPAHHMAVLAMEQYGLMLGGLQPELRPADSRTGIRYALRQGHVPVWLPGRMVIGRPEIPESWDMTSDSLAAWLAARLGADGVVLVKSVAVEEGSSVEELARRGVVDPLLPRFVRDVPACRCIDAAGHHDMAEALRAGQVAGTPLRLPPDPVPVRQGAEDCRPTRPC
jgi:aspartokinase-like uncharacterized kinase